MKGLYYVVRRPPSNLLPWLINSLVWCVRRRRSGIWMKKRREREGVAWNYFPFYKPKRETENIVYQHAFYAVLPSGGFGSWVFRAISWSTRTRAIKKRHVLSRRCTHQMQHRSRLLVGLNYITPSSSIGSDEHLVNRGTKTRSLSTRRRAKNGSWLVIVCCVWWWSRWLKIPCTSIDRKLGARKGEIETQRDFLLIDSHVVFHDLCQKWHRIVRFIIIKRPQRASKQ